MADIINRLLLDTSNFDAKLSKSKKGVNDYQGGIMSLARSTGVKLAGGLGLAIGAGEAFNKVLNSSQTLGDMTARNMAALKGTVDEFFYSIGNGEFFSFLNGLSDIITKAKEAHNAIDQLGNTKISHNYFTAENEGKIAKAQYTAKNKFAPIPDRIEAFNNWRSALSAQGEINRTLQSDLIKAITSSVEAEIGTSKMKVTIDDVRMALKIDVTNPQKRDELKSKYSDEYKEYKKGISWIESRRKTSISQAPARAFEINKKYDKEIEELTQKYRESIIVNAMLNKYKDNELTNIASMAIEHQKLSTSLSSISREYNETAMEFNNANKAVKGFVAVVSLEGHKVYTGNTATLGSSKDTTPPPVGSIAVIDAELSKLNKELIEATTMQARIAVQTTINELEAKKINLKIAVDKGAFAAKYGDRSKASKVNSSEIIGFQYNRGSNLGELHKSAPKIKSPISKKDVDLLDKYQEDLYGISSIMWSMSGVMNEGAAAWMNWSASLLGAVAQAIPAIKQLIPALTAKAGAEAIAGSASSGPLGWISAGAAVAAVFAAFASLPAFSTGGIFEGGSTFGDMNLARVNAGEMILNGVQQGNLFRLLNSGSNAPIQGGNVSFKIHGKDLVGVISNYNNQKSKVR